jgi:hypothetical protein
MLVECRVPGIKSRISRQACEKWRTNAAQRYGSIRMQTLLSECEECLKDQAKANGNGDENHATLSAESVA